MWLSGARPNPMDPRLPPASHDHRAGVKDGPVLAQEQAMTLGELAFVLGGILLLVLLIRLRA